MKLKIKKIVSIVASAALALTLANLSSLSASAAVVTVTLTNPTPVTDVATGTTVALAGVVGDPITIVSSAALDGTVTVNFGGASAVATAIPGVNTFSVVIPSGAQTGAVTLADSASAHTATVAGFQIWPSRTEPYVMPSGHLNITYGDLQRILDQIKIGEAHRDRTRVANATTANQFLNQRTASATPLYPYDFDLLKRLDDFNLLLIEQPIEEEDILGHAKLAAYIETPICLDESIVSADIARDAIELGAAEIINIKPSRVGGYIESRKIHDVSVANNIPVWCGGMLETGIGRAANLALAAMPGFTLPGDTSASSRYFEVDTTEPFVLRDGHIDVPTGPGIGVDPIREIVDSYTVSQEWVRAL